MQNTDSGSVIGSMSSTSTLQYQNYNEQYEMDDLNNIFTDGLFDSLSRTGPYMFPDPKEIGTLGFVQNMIFYILFKKIITFSTRRQRPIHTARSVDVTAKSRRDTALVR
jgi:hypothetical protein